MSGASHPTVPGVYGPGTHTDTKFTPVPEDTQRIFNHLVSQTPGFTKDPELLSKVKFVGDDYPTLPGPIKAVSVAAALHAMSGVLADEILALRGAPSKERQITVDTTHTAFWFAAIATCFLDGEDVVSLVKGKKLGGVVPDFEQGWIDTPMKYRSTAIYPTKDKDAWYSFHGSLAAVPLLESLGIDPQAADCKTPAEAWEHIAQTLRTKTAAELEFNNLLHGFCGSLCFTPEAWNNSEMGKSLARHPVVNVQQQTQAAPTPAVAFPPLDPADMRPLAGVKVVEMTRIIAGPQIGAVLSSYGADVIRINAPHLIDVNVLQLTLNAGKRTIAIDLRKPDDAAYLRSLLADADVFVQGFRQSRLEKWGLGLNSLLRMAAERQKGIVYVSENCYGPDGYYAERPGWQQIADAAAGSAYVQGRALGLPEGECVLPSLPVSDMTTGIIGAVGAMQALRDRAVKGGSYYVHAALTTVNTFALTPEVGLYQPETVKECADRFRWGPMRSSDHVFDLLFTVWDGWTRVFADRLREDNDKLFKRFDRSEFAGRRIAFLKPVVSFGSDDASSPEWRTPSVPYCLEDKANVAFR
ncbi:Succinyl-CoA--L-malate CoA-transferase beta subunit [Lasiodiplodia hormozganensis]|uniref:Succinyl-CoA--L-malate CoA-transferase beta subunit n=1 Tax=Lasiodiplodia hormozganensis TaxID=869390 RepID=A0AA39Z5V7_9PEZI|nr:Succinyl-CoA--L-malate CoA-transferase beta subunit [Lasiodiplodia hormozganensis]